MAPEGCFTTHDALANGLTRRGLARLVRTGLVVSVARGAFVDGAQLQAADAIGRHLLDVRGQLLVLGDGWYAARRSAVLAHGLPLIGQPPTVPQLYRDVSGLARMHDRHHRQGCLPPADRDEVKGMPTLSVARTVVDLAREEPLRNAVVVADAALRQGLPRAELASTLTRMHRWPGVVAARRAVDFADPLSESVLESVSRVSMHLLGLPPPELQVEVWLGDELLARVDALWQESLTVGEADGLGKYGGDDAAVRLALRAEKRRTERLEDVGLEVVRWGWPEAWRPEGVLDGRLNRAFERGRRQRLDPRVRFVRSTPMPVRRTA